MGKDFRTFTLTVDPDDTQDTPSSPDVRPTPDDEHGGSDTRTVTQGQTRGVSSLTAYELGQVLDNGGMIAAVLPELTVSESGMYSSADIDCFGDVVLSSDVPAGYALVWNAFVRGTQIPASDGAIFFGTDGSETLIVPENHRVSVSAYLEAGTLYAIVISARPNGDPGSSSGGCGVGTLGFLLLIPLVFRGSRVMKIFLLLFVLVWAFPALSAQATRAEVLAVFRTPEGNDLNRTEPQGRTDPQISRHSSGYVVSASPNRQVKGL